MKLRYRILNIAALFAVNVIALNIIDDAFKPQIGRHLAVETLNGGNAEFAAYQIWQHNCNGVHLFVWTVFVIISTLLLISPIRRLFPNTAKPTASMAAFMAVAFAFSTSACVKPYNTPQYVEVKNNETAFVVSLEGDTSDQDKLNSSKFKNAKQVASKRIQVDKRWNQTGRFTNDGDWIPTMRVLVVDRSPVTREWKAPEDQQGHAIKLKGADQDKAIWVESADSVGFSMGFTATGYIKEEDAATFLYMYAGNSLAVVMDQEIRARVQQVTAEVAAKYKLDELRGKKQEIIDAVKADIVKFFSERGITITTVGMFGGMTYENPKIQDSIDQTFVAQQEKVNTAAQLAAQADKNTIIVQEATARAQAIQQEAEGKAKAYAAEAQGKAEAIKVETAALVQAQQNPAFMQLRELETTQKIFAQWNGAFPTYYIGGPQSVTGLLALPTVGTPAIPATK